jgi:DNA segregation ATPase FtsK/SpoIIIE, S-DNA-T family
MMNSSPQPLQQRRLTRLVHGLGQRLTGSMQRKAREVELLRDRLQNEQQLLDGVLQQSLVQQEQQSAQTTTQWDEETQQCWDRAELQTYRAIYEIAERERRLKREARTKVEEATAEAQKRIELIDRRFMHAKEAPVKRLRNYRSTAQALKDRLTAADNAARTSLAQRSLAVPSTELSEIRFHPPGDSAEAFRQLQEIVEAAERQSRRITDSLLASFFDSVGFWATCGAIFLVSWLLPLLTGVLELVPATLLASGITVAFLLLGFLGIRPWLTQAAAAEYPKLRGLIQLGASTCERGDSLAVAENEAELARLAKKRDERFWQAKEWRDGEVASITRQLEKSIADLKRRASEDKQSARVHLDQSLRDTAQKFEARLVVIESHARREQEERQAAFDARCQELRRQIEEIDRSSSVRLQIATQKALHVVARSRRWCQEHFPPWEKFQSAEDWPMPLAEPMLPIGEVAMDEVLSESTRRDIAPAQMHAPVLFAPLQDDYLVITGDPASPLIQNLIRNLVVRGLTSIPAGRAEVCVIDPPGLGRDFGWLMHLGDFDPQLVHHRVWTQSQHISRQLNALALAAEDFIQQSLRNEYRDIVEYNREAGALAEPFRMLVWSSLPAGMDDQAWRSLQSILDTGARCGIIPILIVDPSQSWPSSDQRQIVERRGLHLRLSEDGKSLLASSGRLEEIRVLPAEAPPDRLAQSIVQEVGRRALLASRVEVPLANMVPQPDVRWQADSSHCLEIPIGQSGVGRTHSLKLGIGTAQHAIIAGKTGSGKSSLLHALITSAMLKYSPEQLRLVLLDFKKGVEFQVYANARVPHADIIGIESHREFGFSALEYVDQCMQRRGEVFRESGVQDIASWNALHPENKLPRMMVIIDEFQELFVEDDKLSGQASLILDRIVRQGRSFGIHAVLSSQTLAGSYSLPRTTLGQMAVRIALQCDPSDAQIIFAEDNPAAARLKHPGQAVYNDAGGRIEGNQPMQIGWLPKSQQLEWFAEWSGGYQNRDSTTNRLGRTVVYDGNRAATWNSNNVELAIKTARQEVNPNAIWCVVGESVAIRPAVVLPLTRQAGRNVLLVGSNDAQAAAVINTLTASFVRASQSAGGAGLYAVQGAKPTDAKTLELSTSWRRFGCESKMVEPRGAVELVAEVHQMLRDRTGEEAEAAVHRPVLLNLIQLGRIKSLRREDDFASFGETELTPDKQLEEILRDGPGVGVHCLIWAENYSTVNRWLSRTALREMEIRLLMQMSASDSTNLMDSIAASRLGDHVMLLYDEASGQEKGFRPFACDSLGSLVEWVKRK